jgi:two-component system phosphate regulon response regulator PhoB
MASQNVLIVEDDVDIRDMLRFSLEREGFHITEAEDAENAIRLLDQPGIDVALIDWMLPGMSGVEFVRRLRLDDHTKELPLIMLTARGEERDKLRGFDVGADDYLTKPFSPKELVARIRAVMRRSANSEDDLLSIGDLSLDTQAHRLVLAGEAIHVGPTEYRLLEFLMRNPERVFSREQLLDRVWGRNVYVEDRTVDVHVLRLRKLLAKQDYDRHIQTVRGAGYRFSTKVG